MVGTFAGAGRPMAAAPWSHVAAQAYLLAQEQPRSLLEGTDSRGFPGGAGPRRAALSAWGWQGEAAKPLAELGPLLLPWLPSRRDLPRAPERDAAGGRDLSGRAAWCLSAQEPDGV